MNAAETSISRRAFISGAGAVAITAGTSNAAQKLDAGYDVCIYGATPSGVAAAVAAARSGANVLLLEECAHVGGIVSGGLTNTDIRKKGAVGGLFKEFVRRVRDHYVTTYGADSEQVKVCQGGHMFEPRVAELVFNQMLAGESRVRLLLRYRVIAARVTAADGKERDAEPGKRFDGAQPQPVGAAVKLTSLVAENLAQPGSRLTFSARVFIDATYEGDLAALAGVPYRVGRESRETFGETLAGSLFMRFGDSNPLPGSTGAADNGIQAFCFRFHVTKEASNLVPVEKPPGYNRDDYRAVLADLRAGKVKRLRDVVQLFPMPNNKFEVNSDHPHGNTGIPSESLDLAEENWAWPEAGVAERARIFQRYWSHNEGLMWFLQHDAEVPQHIRDEALQYGFPKDEFIDNRHRPHYLYVRQGRRIWGEYNFTQREAILDSVTGLPKRKPDGIAIAEFEFDSHGVVKFNPAYPGVRGGYFFVPHDPLQIPYRVVVPVRVDGLLVPVACSASHVGYQTIRMEPVFMALGEACGIAAKTAIDTHVEVRGVNVSNVQREILKRGGVILYETQSLRPDGL